MAKVVGAGGTPGGLGHFFGGAALSGIGIYLLFSRVVVSAGYGYIGAFGASFSPGGGLAVVMIPFAIGVAMLFGNGKSIAGWGLTGLGLVLTLVEIISTISIHFQPTSLPAFLGMVVMIAGGAGLILRSLADHGEG